MDLQRRYASRKDHGQPEGKVEWQTRSLTATGKLLFAINAEDEIQLQNGEEREWSIFDVYCHGCGLSSLESKYKVVSGAKCRRCSQHRLEVSKKLSGNKSEPGDDLSCMADLLFRFTSGSLVRDPKASRGIKPMIFCVDGGAEHNLAHPALFTGAVHDPEAEGYPPSPPFSERSFE